MEANFWIERWEKNEIGFHQADANPALVEHFDKLGLAPGARVFVPLCGKTLDIGWLLGQGFRVAGAELSELAIQQLFEELGVAPRVSELGALNKYHAEGIDIFVGDMFDLEAKALGAIDAIYDRAALVALPPEIRVTYTAHLRNITKGAPQLLLTFEYDQSVMPGPPFSISKDEVHEHYTRAYDVTMITSHDVPGGIRGLAPASESVWALSVAENKTKSLL